MIGARAWLAGLAPLVTLALGACGDDGGSGGSGSAGGGGSSSAVGGGGAAPVSCVELAPLVTDELELVDESPPGSMAEAEVTAIAPASSGGFFVLVTARAPGAGALFSLAGADLSLDADRAGAFVVQIAADGSAVASETLSGLGDGGRATAVSASTDGTVIVAGTFASEMFDAAGATLTRSNPPGSNDAFVAKLSVGAGASWATSLGGDGGDSVTVVPALATDGGGSIYMGAAISGALVLGGETSTAPAVIAKLTPDGDPGFLLGLASKAKAPVALVGTASAIRAVGEYDGPFSFGAGMVGKDPFLGTQVYQIELGLDGTPLSGRALTHPDVFTSAYQGAIAGTASYVVAAGYRDDGSLKGSFAARQEGAAFAWSYELAAPSAIVAAVEDDLGELLLFGSGPAGTCQASETSAVASRVSASGQEVARTVVSQDPSAAGRPRALARLADGRLAFAFGRRIVLATPF